MSPNQDLLDAELDKLQELCDKLEALTASRRDHEVPLGIVDRLHAAIAKARGLHVNP